MNSKFNPGKINIDVRRKLIQFMAFALSNPYAGNLAKGRLYKGPWKNFCNPGINCYSCPAASLSCPIGSLQAVNGSINMSWSFYVVGTLCAFGILLGRAVCGFICPFGLIQELLYKIPFVKRRLPRWPRYIKYVMLAGVFLFPVLMTDVVGLGDPFFCKYICPAGTLEGGLPLLITHPEMRGMAGPLLAFKIVIAILVLAGCLVVCRCFCKVLCPLGAFYGFFNKISLLRYETDTASCISCGKCSRICPMDIDPSAEPNSMECIRCGRCINACSEHAISIRKLALTRPASGSAGNTSASVGNSSTGE